MGRKAKAERGLYKQSGSNNWHYDFMVKGRRFRGSTGTENKKLARDIANARKIDELRLRSGFSDGNPDIKFSELVKRYLASRDPSKPSHKIYSIICDTLCGFMGGMYVDKITGEVINRYISARLTGKIKVGDKTREPVKRTTVNRDITVLRSIFYFGIEEELCVKNPAKGKIDFAAEEAAAKSEYLTVEEVQKYLDACSPAYYPVALCAVETGMRKQEILSLLWNQVDLHRKLIVLTKTKSGKRRVVYISERLTAVLRGLKCTSGCANVFLNRDGQPYRDVRSAHRAALNRSGIQEERDRQGKPTFRFHDIRHTAASIHASETGDIYMTSKFLGHSSIEMTMRYAHLTEDKRREAAQAVSDRITSTERHNNVIAGQFKERKENEGTQKSLLILKEL